jgi:pyridoxine 5'-phosphate synthase PdxJ
LAEYREDKRFKIFRIWAYQKGENVLYITIKFDARHVKDEDVQLYIRDTTQHHQYQNICNDPSLRVFDKRSVRVQDVVHAKKMMRGNINAEFFVKGLSCRQDASPVEHSWNFK